MDRIGERAYRCTSCDAVVEVDIGEKPVVMLAAHSGKPTERVVLVAGVEVHRCRLAAVR